MFSRRIQKISDKPARYRVTRNPKNATYTTRDAAEKRASHLDALGWLRSSQG